MIPKKAIEKAIEGGWNARHPMISVWQTIALDASFWQALGKALGWPEKFKEAHDDNWFWQNRAHRLYHLILTEQSTDQFWHDVLAGRTFDTSQK